MTQPRVQVPGTGGGGAAVVLVKFNDYMCPPCGQSYREHKPVLAKLQQQYPGKITFIMRDFPWDPECNTMGGEHQASCEAAAAVRLAREKGRAEALEEWLYSNQASLTPANVRQAASEIAGVTDFDAQYPKMLELVRGDIAQGRQLGISGTPTFYMNGLRLPNLRANMFQAAIEWELQRVK
jgi:protein-disulfide isomerase